MFQNPDNLVDYIVRYKLKNYNHMEYNEDGILENKKSLKKNIEFVDFVIDNGYFKNISSNKNKKKFIDRIKYLSLLIDITENDLLIHIIQRLATLTN